MRFLRWMAAAWILLLVSCGPAETAATPEYSVPPEEKRLCIYTSHKREVWWPIVKEFEDRTGIWAEVTEGGTSELLDRIRDIHSSEKVLYRQVLDLYATSVDYNPKAEESVRFFKVVQNKLHYAAHGHTAAEVIFERADADKPFMGLTSFDGEMPTLKDTRIAKNYLNADELKVLNNIVSGYFDFAEIQAIRHRPMYMDDYIKQLDGILSGTGEKLLTDAGSVSHRQAIEKAEKEYRKYQVKTLSPVEEAYLDTLKQLEKTAKEKRENE